MRRISREEFNKVLDHASKLASRNVLLERYVEAAEYGFKVRGEWECAHKHPGPDEICSRCKLQSARSALGLK